MFLANRFAPNRSVTHLFQQLFRNLHRVERGPKEFLW